MPSLAFRARVLVTCLAVFWAQSALSQSAWYEGHEASECSWQEAGGNAKYRILQHQRVQQKAHTGDACEHVLVDGDGGTHVYFSHAVGNPCVIAELLPSVWINSDRAGIQLLARIVLPRTEDPRTGRPITTMVRGTSYNEVGRWQQLRIDQMPLLLDRSIRVLRMQMGVGVDGREAFVDRIFLNVYGGPGKTNVWIDDLDIAGHVERPPQTPGLVTPPPRPPATIEPAQPTLLSGVATDAIDVNPTQPADNRIELVRTVLQVDGNPVFPLAVEYRGESLRGLKELGFNTIWLDRPPTREFLGEIGRLGLWAVCPPPYLPEEAAKPGQAVPPKRIGEQYRPVIAWNMGVGKCESDLALTRRWARQVRAADIRSRRPLICRPESDLRGFSRYVDLLLVSHSPLATSLELTDYGTWVRQRPRLARPGTVVWSTVQTQPALTLEHQWQMAGKNSSMPPLLSSEQIRLMAYTSIAAGSRGLLFQSCSSLDATDPATRARAAALELLNLELKLIHPWVAAGSDSTTVQSSRPEVSGAVLRLERSRLLLPIWSGQGAQFVPGQSAEKTVTFIIPGVPDSHRAYEIAPGGLRPVRRQARVAGGMQVTLDEFSLSRPVLLTEDQKITTALLQRTRSPGLARRAGELYRCLAIRKLQVVEDVDRRLSGRKDIWDAEDYIATARKHLLACDQQISRDDHQSACVEAQRAMRMLRIVERQNWLTAVKGLSNPVASPATVCFSTIPWHWDLASRTRDWQLGMNFLPVGDFEDVGSMMSAGWRHLQHETDGISALAEIVPTAAHNGQGGLRLMAAAKDPETAPALVESPPVWLSSPPLDVEAGTLIRIQGWVQVPAAITGSVDGLLIFDSLSGQPLAERIGETTGWEPFTLYRVVTQSGQMTVTFALSGIGEAWLDDVTVQILTPVAQQVSQFRGRIE